MSESLAAALAIAVGQPAARLAPVAGGDLNDAYAATLADGSRVFVKTSADPAAAGSFSAEAAGLRWLADANALPLPEVLAVADDPPDAAPTHRAAPTDHAAPTDVAPPAGPRFLALQYRPGRARRPP